MYEFVLLENLNRFNMKTLLSALTRWSNVFSLNFPLKGYGTNARLIEAGMKGLEEFVITTETFDLGSHASINKRYEFNQESLAKLVELSDDWNDWEWSKDMPEELILYRRDSELVLFEAYKLGETYFAILNQTEHLFLQTVLGTRLPFKRIVEFEPLSQFDVEKPRTSGAVRSYLKALASVPK